MKSKWWINNFDSWKRIEQVTKISDLLIFPKSKKILYNVGYSLLEDIDIKSKKLNIAKNLTLFLNSWGYGVFEVKKFNLSEKHFIIKMSNSNIAPIFKTSNNENQNIVNYFFIGFNYNRFAMYLHLYRFLKEQYIYRSK